MRDYSRYLDNIVSLVYPRRCPVCDECVPLSEGLICKECAAQITYIREPRCRSCGKQLYDESAIFCGDCGKRAHVYDCGCALYDYRSMRRSVYRFKYSKRSEYARYYAQDMVKHLGSRIEAFGADALIPVPLHPKKKALRGYNQAELLARELSRLTGIPCVSNLVRRTVNTVPQKELDDRERQNNLKKAFHISSDVVKLKKTILVDDIYTTGSTIDAVAKELKRHGVEKVYYVALCIGEGR